MLDPIWLWPVEGRVDKDVFMGDLNTCDVHMHNLKSVKLTNVQVQSSAKKLIPGCVNASGKARHRQK